MHDPSHGCYCAAIDLLLYIGHTKSQGISFNGSTAVPAGLAKVDSDVVSNGGLLFSDSTWHQSNSLGYNMFGYVAFFFGGPIAFAAKQLKVIALSSAEAEYAAASYCCSIRS